MNNWDKYIDYLKEKKKEGLRPFSPEQWLIHMGIDDGFRGYVIEARNPEDAIARFKKENPDRSIRKVDRVARAKYYVYSYEKLWKRLGFKSQKEYNENYAIHDDLSNYA